MSSNGLAATLDTLAVHWSKPLKRPNADLVLKTWAALEAESFSVAAIARLDSHQAAEKFLWPTLTDDALNQHVLLLAAILNYKRELRHLQWSAFTSAPDRFTLLFRRILTLLLDPSLTLASRTIALALVSTAFQSLEQDVVRKECAPLVSIAIWENLHSDRRRDTLLDAAPARRKAWKLSRKRWDAADQDGKQRLRLERAWLFNLLLDFIKRINNSKPSTEDATYCARFLEFLIDIISQLPTRRYSIALLDDLNLLPLLKLSTLHKSKGADLFRDLVALYQQFSSFHIDDAGQVSATRSSTHKQSLLALQKTALQHFPEQLKVLALSNLATISQTDELRPLLEVLDDAATAKLCELMGVRTTYPASAGFSSDRNFLLHVLLIRFSAVPDLQESMRALTIDPTEMSLYDESLLRYETYDGKEPLAVPKLNLQYLTLSDCLWRSFKLHQAEAFYEIRKDMESIVRKMKPQKSRDMTSTHFSGFSKMAVPIEKPAIIDVAPPDVGEINSAHVRAEVILDVSRLGDRIRAEWDNLKPHDIVFLLAVKAVEGQSGTTTNGASVHVGPSDHGTQFIRTAQVVQVLDDKGKPIRNTELANGHIPRGKTRRLLLDLDSKAFHQDKERLVSGKGDVYKNVNVLARRPGRENNFKPLLESVRSLATSGTKLPAWLQDVYLGYGQPSSATYPQIDDKVAKVDFLDTFVDWDHLRDSLSGKQISYDGDHEPTPPYVLHTIPLPDQPALPNPKKRRRDLIDDADVSSSSVVVSSYTPKNTGPYSVQQHKGNRIRFTPAQTEALIRGSQPGLSLIVGPPGTGKTDVATQLINILYHNFPEERILLVAHSNQALNQLFQKIVALDIDERHLLRLGHGEEELDTESSFGKFGRVEFFMQKRVGLLTEVNRLAASINVEGAHGNSCETADYFNQVFVQPGWTRFWTHATSEDATVDSIRERFPFTKFFSNAPVAELFQSTGPVEGCRETARGCQYYIDKIFAELEAIRPFEVLRNSRDQANHLLVKEARIIAMTSTHAAIRRSEIAALGFHYDTLVMEEAAQVTEVESFIPCAMQNADTKTGELPLKRIVLVGDHLQNSPIIQNFALRDYANLEQSLFLRLIRLGVPHVMLDAQGRCRPSITNLFSWRYPGLKNLPHIISQPQFQRANAGIRHEYQFINIDDYQGAGEREPTPHFIQNLGEAEYAVALFQYLRLLGYPAKSISILTAYAGQRALIRDVLEHRCKGNKLFGLPKLVSTVDKYQGEQNDYIILSLTRTKTPGYLRDVRRLTVALSRARFGLYILGRRALFQDLPGLDIAMQRGNADGHLEVVTGEIFPATRGVDEEVASTEIHGVEHLGQYVYEMTQAKIKSLGGSVSLTAASGVVDGEDEAGGDDDGLEDEAEADAEVDPLHENV